MKEIIYFCRPDDPWCNGNTTVFGTVILGSSPSGSTFLKAKQLIFSA